ncbi:MAG: sugar phosphate isomerase/epimerase [Oscillospiraceae bacterium]|nr:sugar phosphate isomerase/epimerase [Oscillospiraceae bacterium]
MNNFILSAFADEIDKDLTVQMDVLDSHKIKHIEMRGVNGRNITEHSLNEVREIKKQLDARGFALSAVGSPIGKIKITDDFLPHLDLFKHTLEIAQIMETKYIRMFSFFVPQNGAITLYKDEVMERLEKLVDASFGSGVTLLHENEKEIYGDTPARCLEILQTFPQIRATFDPANFIQCGVDTLKAFETLEDYVDYLHIKDARKSDGAVVPAGAGDGNIAEILRRLKRRGFEGFLSIEPHLADFDGFAGLEGGKFAAVNVVNSQIDKFAIAANALKNILEEEVL